MPRQVGKKWRKNVAYLLRNSKVRFILEFLSFIELSLVHKIPRIFKSMQWREFQFITGYQNDSYGKRSPLVGSVSHLVSSSHLRLSYNYSSNVFTK